MAVDEMDFGDFLAEKTRHAQSAVHGLCESDASTQPFPLDSLDLTVQYDIFLISRMARKKHQFTETPETSHHSLHE